MKRILTKIQKAVQSAVIDVYDTKKAVTPSDPAADTGNSSDRDSSSETNPAPSTDGSIDESISFTGWITGANVNVRSSASTDASIISTVPYGNPVSVTGAITTGSQVSWYRIDLDETTGFISAPYVSKAAPHRSAKRHHSDRRTAHALHFRLHRSYLY